MTLSLEHLARLLLGVLTPKGDHRNRVPRLDLMTLNGRDLADVNLPTDIRNRVMGQRDALELRRRV